MLTATRLKQLAPYVILLTIGVALYSMTNQMAGAEMPGQIGPDRWPKLIIGLMIGVCLFEIGRRMLWNPEPPAPTLGELEALGEDQPDKPWLVFGAVAVTVVYLLLLDVIGFVLGTLLYTAALMWFGGTKRPLLVGIMSLVITISFAFVFMKLIFIALPVGREPFSWVSFALMKLFGV
jgi:putative tricarboxylic transport membrane protein